MVISWDEVNVLIDFVVDNDVHDDDEQESNCQGQSNAIIPTATNVDWPPSFLIKGVSNITELLSEFKKLTSINLLKNQHLHT